MSVFYTNEEVKQYTFSGDLKKYDDFDKIIRMLEEVSGIKISIKESNASNGISIMERKLCIKNILMTLLVKLIVNVASFVH